MHNSAMNIINECFEGNFSNGKMVHTVASYI